MQVCTVSKDSHPVHQFVLHGVSNLVDAFIAIFTCDEPPDPLLLLGHSTSYRSGVILNFVPLKELHNLFAHNLSGNYGLGKGISTQSIQPVHIPTSCLAGGKESLETISRAIFVGPNSCHGVMLGRTYRNQLGDGVDPEEIIADLFNFSQLGLDVVFTQVADVQPEMIAVRAFHAQPLANVMGHPSGDHIPGCQLSLLWLILVHESLFVHIQQGAAVTSTALGHQNVGWNDACRVKLDCLRVT